VIILQIEVLYPEASIVDEYHLAEALRIAVRQEIPRAASKVKRADRKHFFNSLKPDVFVKSELVHG